MSTACNGAGTRKAGASPATLRRRRVTCVGLACALLLLLGARPARADGAFPDSSGIMAPVTRPHDIILATNFGVVSSIDDGQTWTWSCEQDRTSFAIQYQLGAPPLSRLFALSAVGLVYSDDRACSWAVAGGAVTGSTITDAFPDPSNPNRVLAIATTSVDGGAATYRIFESADAGTTFGPIRYTASNGDRITGVEIARSAANTIYVTLISTTYVPRLARSLDGGTTWETHNLDTALGADTASVLIIAVAPDNANRIFLRTRQNAGGEKLAVTDDVGVTVRTPLALPGGVMTSFVRTPSGTLLVGGVVGTANAAFRSTDAGTTFAPLPTPPSLRGLAARGPLVYGVTDNAVDGYAVGVSSDEGTSWKPLMSYEDIQAVDACVKTLCANDCAMRTDLGQWSGDLCDATPAPRSTDGGATVSSDAGTGGHGAGDAGGGGTGGAKVAASAGCHCATASHQDRPDWLTAAFALGLAWLTGTRRSRRRARPRTARQNR